MRRLKSLNNSVKCGKQSLKSFKSRKKVVSTLMDLRWPSLLTRRVSSPRESLYSVKPILPNCSRKKGSSRARKSAQVFSPSACIFSAVRGPTPYKRSTGKSKIKASIWCGRMTNKPSGLSQSLAILARNLFGATPADTTRPSSAKTRARISRAISVALPACCGESVTSKYASSKDNGSTSDVYSR